MPRSWTSSRAATPADVPGSHRRRLHHRPDDRRRGRLFSGPRSAVGRGVHLPVGGFHLITAERGIHQRLHVHIMRLLLLRPYRNPHGGRPIRGVHVQGHDSRRDQSEERHVPFLLHAVFVPGLVQNGHGLVRRVLSCGERPVVSSPQEAGDRPFTPREGLVHRNAPQRRRPHASRGPRSQERPSETSTSVEATSPPYSSARTFARCVVHVWTCRRSCSLPRPSASASCRSLPACI